MQWVNAPNYNDMKHILLFLLMALSLTAAAQSRIGYTSYEIRQQFSNKQFYSGVTDKGTDYIYWADQTMSVTYYFDGEGDCVITAVMVRDNRMLNYFVERCNKDYVIIDDHNWKWYTDFGGIINISLTEINGMMTLIYSLQQ